MATEIPQLMPQLYHDLISLCSAENSFYYKDIPLDSTKYRVFSYRLCSYATFHSYPSALNCRGVMFNITDGENVQLVCLPPEKFFNYEEGTDQIQRHENGRFGDKMEKMDGSLISTFLHINDVGEEVLKLKSKTALMSDQALEAMGLLTGTFSFTIGGSDS
jgi:T4 RnlA family RNA ligase